MRPDRHTHAPGRRYTDTTTWENCWSTPPGKARRRPAGRPGNRARQRNPPAQGRMATRASGGCWCKTSLLWHQTRVRRHRGAHRALGNQVWDRSRARRVRGGRAPSRELLGDIRSAGQAVLTSRGRQPVGISWALGLCVHAVRWTACYLPWELTSPGACSPQRLPRSADTLPLHRLHSPALSSCFRVRVRTS